MLPPPPQKSPQPRITRLAAQKQERIREKISQTSKVALDPLPRHAIATSPPRISTCAPTPCLAYASECKNFQALFCAMLMRQQNPLPGSSVTVFRFMLGEM